MIKKYDIVATVGTYKKNGEIKNKFKNVGVVMEKDGKPFILLDRTFNPAGLPNQDGRDNVLLSLYTPKGEGQPDSNYTANNPQALDDEIPF